MSIAGRKFDRGVGTHAPSRMYGGLGRESERFPAWVRVDDEVGGDIGSVEFHIYGDGKPVWRSGAMKAGQPAKAVDAARNACATSGVSRTSMGTTRSSPPKSPAAAA